MDWLEQPHLQHAQTDGAMAEGPSFNLLIVTVPAVGSFVQVRPMLPRGNVFMELPPPRRINVH